MLRRGVIICCVQDVNEYRGRGGWAGDYWLGQADDLLLRENRAKTSRGERLSCSNGGRRRLKGFHSFQHWLGGGGGGSGGGELVFGGTVLENRW